MEFSENPEKRVGVFNRRAFMKKILVIALTIFAFNVAKAQISDVQQKGNYVYVYGEQNNQLSYLQISSSDEYKGMGASFFVVQKGNYLYTYDEKSHQIAYLQISSSDKFKSAGGSTFNVQKGNYIYTYDKKCNQISYRQI
jgi:hypothetical protein